MPGQAFKAPDIIRRETFVVDDVDTNDYGDLVVKDTQAKTYKVSSKRAKLFDVFQVGATVEVGYAVYMEKEYIAIAHQTGTHTSVAPQAAPPVVPQATTVPAPPPTNKVDHLKNRAVALSYAKDMVCAKVVTCAEMFDWADKILTWIEK